MTLFSRGMNLRTLKKAALFGLLSFCVFGGTFLLAHSGFAQTADAFETIGESSGLATDSISVIIARIIRVFLSVIGIITVLIVIYAGWLWMTSQGDPGKVQKARDMLRNAVIGLAIIMGSYGITTFVLNALLSAAGYGSGIETIAERYSEPLSGSLGSGIIDDHYPSRHAIDIPRNTRILVTFKESVNPSSIVSGYDVNPDSTLLNTDTVLIYPTAEGEGAALATDQVVVAFDEEAEIFSFDPVDLLGNPDADTNYTVSLTPGLEKSDGTAAFTGVYAAGYRWTFEVSTEVDLTPPVVTSVLPISTASSAQDRNIIVEISFNEAMDPLSVAGTYSTEEGVYFTNIEVEDSSGSVEGAFAISNGYRTIGFTPGEQCGEDPCGDAIYCLPALEDITVTAHAASVGDDAPQAIATGVTFDGAVDVSGNSLDGDEDGEAAGSESDSVEVVTDEGATVTNDDYAFSFETTAEVNDIVPEIVSFDPSLGETSVSVNTDVTAAFSVTMQSSTLNTNSVSLWPDPWYEFGFSNTNTLSEGGDYTLVTINHPTLVSSEEDGQQNYYPVITNGVKSSYQICFHPAYGPPAIEGSATSCASEDDTTGRVDTGDVYCCDGFTSDEPCVSAVEGTTLPY